MVSPPRLYVAAAGKHVGKTTSTLGLITALRRQGLHTGYCKPVGQQYVPYHGQKVDKDALLFAQHLDFELIPSLHSPVILGPGTVCAHMEDDADFDFPGQIQLAAQTLEKSYDQVVYEGTGHPGVGSVVGVSNAQVARLLGAGVVLVLEAGIGKALDMLTLNRALFAAEGVPVLGVIFNKTRPDKLEKVSSFLRPRLRQLGIPCLGILPYEEQLSLPLVQTLSAQVKAEVNPSGVPLDRPVRQIIPAEHLLHMNAEQMQDVMVIGSGDSLEQGLLHMQYVCTQARSGCPLAAVMLPQGGSLSTEAQRYLRSHQIPWLTSAMDSYALFVKLHQTEVKIKAQAPWKIQAAVELFAKHVDLRPLHESIIV
ncbi:MAG: AAA family ATPase [Bacteroidota bacterium]